MRLARLLGGLALVLALPWTAGAGEVLYHARVSAPDAQVRSGPSPQFYATNQLRLGQIVDVVDQRADGWLAIKPPLGSFSWVQTRMLEERKQNVFVVLTPAETLIGSQEVSTKPTTRGPTLLRGTTVFRVGRTITDQDGVWLQIEPAEREVRYVRAADVERTVPPPEPALTAQAPPGPAAPTSFSSPVAPAPVPGARVEAPTSHPLWLQAQEAKRAGRNAEAASLLDQLGQSLAASNYPQALLCYNEAATLRNSGSGTMPVSYPPRTAPDFQTSASNVPVCQPILQPTACTTGPAAPALRLGTPSSAPGQTQQQYYGQTAAAATLAQWSGAGRLRSSGYRIDARPTFVLETSWGETMMYVTPQSTLDLSPYVGRLVDLHGLLVYRGDVRKNFMTADFVSPLPEEGSR